MRRKAAEKAAGEDQWWLKYPSTGEGKQRELGKWRARLKRFEKIVQTSEASGEKENAERLAAQARLKISQLEEALAE